jgi:GTPase SAR1 family protein
LETDWTGGRSLRNKQTKMPRENKVVLLGPPGAGKTSFFNRCTKPQYSFNKNHVSTTLIDTHLITQRVGDKVVDFYLVDTVGSSIFGESGTGGNVFVNVRMVLCLFNLNSKRSWDALVSSDRFDNLEYEIGRRNGIMSRVDFIMV